MELRVEARADAETEELKQSLVENMELRTEELIMNLKEFCQCKPYLANEYLQNEEAANFIHAPIEGTHWHGAWADQKVTMPGEENRTLFDDLMDSILEFGLINKPKLIANDHSGIPYLILAGNQRRRALVVLLSTKQIKECADKELVSGKVKVDVVSGFKDEEEIYRYMIADNLIRKGMHSGDQRIFDLHLAKYYKAIRLDLYESGKEARERQLQGLPIVGKPHNTQEIIAKKFNISKGKVSEAKRYADLLTPGVEIRRPNGEVLYGDPRRFSRTTLSGSPLSPRALMKDLGLIELPEPKRVLLYEGRSLREMNEAASKSGPWAKFVLYGVRGNTND